MNLQRFIDAKREELANLRRQLPPALPVSSRPDFLAALRGEKTDSSPLRVVAEFKRSSPSAGVINATRTPEEAAQAYASGGASCMSVLTEEKYFRGCTEDLFRAHAVAPALPLLRKDFIFHELQVRQTAATPASALLLIVALTPDAAQLRDLRNRGFTLSWKFLVKPSWILHGRAERVSFKSMREISKLSAPIARRGCISPDFACRVKYGLPRAL